MAILDAEKEKSCLEEISHLVLDTGKNVTVALLSNNHQIPFAKCSDLLKDWLQKNKETSTKLDRSFMVQYKDANGNLTVAIIPESKVKELKSQNVDISEMLYGIQLSTTNRTIGLSERLENVHINIKAKSTAREIQHKSAPVDEPAKIHVISEKVTSAGTKNISNMFSKPTTSKQTVKSTEDSSVKHDKEVKPEKMTPVKEVKPEKATPKKESPVKRRESPRKHTAQAKNNTAKGNIASFFSKGAAPKKDSKPVVPAKEPEVKKEEPETSKKRPASEEIVVSDDEVIPGTPQEERSRQVSKRLKSNNKKKPDPKMKQSKKHSRIAIIDDSSESEEDNEEKRDRERAERQIEPDIEVGSSKINISSDEETRKPSKKTEETKVSSPNKGQKRRKGRRAINRTYQDDEGFIVTVKEFEEYSLSEGEPEVQEKKPKTDDAKSKSEQKSSSKAPAAKTKQGSLLSFFSKK